jgi:hypothetical protein
VLRLKTIDDRGRAVRVPLVFAWDALGAWRARQASWTLRRGPRMIAKLVFSGPALVAIGSIALVALGIRVAIDDPGIGLWLLIFSPVYSSLFMLGFSVVRGALGWGGMLTESIRGTLLQRSRCVSCGYSLAGAEAASDGCVVCAECGAAWDARKLGAEAASHRDVVVPTGWNRPSADSGDPPPDRSNR